MTAHIVYPEDISDIIDNPSELRKQIENFVKDYKIITFSELAFIFFTISPAV